MDNLVLNVKGEMKDISVVRYFLLNNSQYLIYSLNEIDNQSYVTLYVNKIIGDDTILNSESVTDETEWKAVKDAIKMIVKGNAEGTLSVEDLNYNDLDNVTINDSRAFKLTQALTDSLAANKKTFTKDEEVPVNNEPIGAPVSDFSVDIAPVEPIQVEEDYAPEPIEEPKPAVIEPMPEPVSLETEDSVDYKSLNAKLQEENDRLMTEFKVLKGKLSSVKSILDNN